MTAFTRTWVLTFSCFAIPQVHIGLTQPVCFWETAHSQSAPHNFSLWFLLILAVTSSFCPPNFSFQILLDNLSSVQFNCETYSVSVDFSVLSWQFCCVTSHLSIHRYFSLKKNVVYPISLCISFLKLWDGKARKFPGLGNSFLCLPYFGLLPRPNPFHQKISFLVKAIIGSHPALESEPSFPSLFSPIQFMANFRPSVFCFFTLNCLMFFTL